MTNIARLTYLSVLLCLVTAGASAQSSVDSTLRRIDSLYASGSYSLAELEARRLLENDLLGDSLRVVSEQWIASSLVAQGKPALAKEHFTAILRRRPLFDLDPILTSPKILAVLNEARVAFRARRMPEVDTSSLSKPTLTAGMTFRTILFPGWEQWYHGRTTAGVIFFSTGVAALGTGITLEFLRSSARQDYLAATSSGEIETRYQTYNRYRKAEGYAFVAFAAVYLASEIDVFIHDSPVTLSYRPTDPLAPGGALLLSFSLR